MASALDLGDQQRLSTRGAQELARHIHIFLVLRKRHGDIVGVDRDCRLHVVHVLRGQGGRGKPAALTIDALVVREHAADLDLRGNLVATDRVDAQSH